MDKFWEWMNQIGYCRLNTHTKEYVFDSVMSNKNVPKQMLIGYMLEYLVPHKGYHKAMAECFPYVYDGIEKVYSYLEKSIEEMK